MKLTKLTKQITKPEWISTIREFMYTGKLDSDRLLFTIQFACSRQIPFSDVLTVFNSSKICSLTWWDDISEFDFQPSMYIMKFSIPCSQLPFSKTMRTKTLIKKIIRQEFQFTC